MAFEKVDPKVDFPALERAILRFWDEVRAFERLRAQNTGRPPWSFLDGPITANNPMGVHHAWGRTYKDVFCRYFAGTGHDLRYQNGFDCQGLWVEVEVEKEHGFQTKAAIEEYGLANFTEECKRRVAKYAAIQSEQSKRLGYWMDWNDSYYTMSDENNYTIWAFLKKCHDLGYLYKGTDVMPWSGRAGCAYSHMEIADGRRLVTHTSVFVRFPLRGRSNEYLLIWTTTPWTLTSNTGAAVSADLEYLKLRAKKDGALYYLAAENLNYQRLEREYKEGFGAQPWPKGLPKLRTIHQIFQEQGGYSVEGTVSGSALIGWTYDGPFDELPAQQHPGGFAQPMDLIPADQRDWPSGAVGHRVFDPGKDSKGSAYVVAGEGTGIVHSAPGCGDVDHVWGQEHRVVAIAPLDEEGRFIPGFGKFTGMRASDRATAQAIIADLREKRLLVATEEYPHVYPHCWRTGDELIFRLVDEWYISMQWRDEIKEMARQVNWLPASMRGLERELDWLSTMRDWMISKKRYWGLALPIWECRKCGHFDVLGGRDELQARAVEGWKEFDGHSPHRPYVDAIKIRCAKCGALVERIPDVGNPWLDAGIVAYSTVRYSTDRAYWEKWIPADLITECFPGQFRNWFYSILAMSTMMELGKERKRPPFKTLLGHALVLDEQRRTMHKSDGTAIWFEEAAEQLGVDTMRWMYCAQPPTVDLPFGLRHPDEPVTIEGPDGLRITETVSGEPLCKVTSTPADEIRRRVLLPLWNTYAFFCNYARLDNFDPNTPLVPLPQRQDIDRWILSDLQLVIRHAREHIEKYDLPPVCHRLEKFLDDLSSWYVRRNRRRFWRGARRDDVDKLAAYQTLYEVLTTLVRVMGPLIPFVTESIYQNLVARQLADAPESMHLCPYPEPDETRIDHDLSERVAALLRVVSLGRSVRTTAKLKVRQPLAEMIVVPGDVREREALERFQDHLLEELNVKKVTVREAARELMQVSVAPNMKVLGPKFGRQAAAVRAALAQLDGYAVEAALARGEGITILLEGATVQLEPDDFSVTRSYDENWAGAADEQTFVLLDKRITPELRNEGVARDIVRNVQNLRKDAGLNIEDRIRLSVVSDSAAVQAALQQCGPYIQAETLAVELRTAALDSGAAQVDIELDGEPVAIALTKAGA
ncbi:MAG TPA: class I tRNA ligase family protein [Phycisphaerae bacterium]|nr:class I tRNA ligase family protein [Phycisphaerae bacterium]HNU46473.1 class I tRNA ligase family protein [Phycisphaerae bacterium]